MMTGQVAGGHGSGGVAIGSRGVAAKAAGEFRFLTDRRFPGCLWAVPVRSPHPRAEVVSVDVASLRALDGVVGVYTWADVPDTRYNPALLPPDEVNEATRDKRMLTRSPRHVGDEIAVVVASTREQARDAARRAQVAWEPVDPVLTLDDALAAGRVIGRIGFGSAQVEELTAAADLVVTEVFEFAAAHHTCLETAACVALPTSDGCGLEIWTNTQCPTEVRRQVAVILGLAESSVRVRKVDEGGGFGAKQDLYAEPLAGWLALRLGRPVRFAHDRREELTAGRVRAGGRLRVTLAFTRSGLLVAADLTAVLDCGGYASHTPVVLSCLAGHVAAVYPRAKHRFTGTLVATDTIPSGAYRGYGVAEANFAVEQLMDIAADRLGLGPAAIRLRNVVDDRDGRGIASCVRKLAPPAASTKRPVTGEGDVRRASGLAVAAKHSVGSITDTSTAEVALWPGPVLVLSTGTCDSGTGSSRALAELVAAELGAPLDSILVCEGDTDRIADIGSTAQRSVFIGGAAARDAARRLRDELVRIVGGGRTDLTLRWPYLTAPDGRPVGDVSDLAAARPPGSVAGRATTRAPGRGASYCALAVEVAVDVRTGVVRVEHARAVVDCGRVVDVASARGQVVGGIVQGVGLACLDEWTPGRDGRGPRTLLELGTPRAPDAPDVAVTFLDGDGYRQPSGLGELPIVPVAAAVANAVASATGVRCTRTPLRPPYVWSCLHEAEARWS
jgi:xanthine dehydrogenase molybdenum-binding subunit